MSYYYQIPHLTKPNIKTCFCENESLEQTSSHWYYSKIDGDKLVAVQSLAIAYSKSWKEMSPIYQLFSTLLLLHRYTAFAKDSDFACKYLVDSCMIWHVWQGSIWNCPGGLWRITLIRKGEEIHLFCTLFYVIIVTMPLKESLPVSKMFF